MPFCKEVMRIHQIRTAGIPTLMLAALCIAAGLRLIGIRPKLMSIWTRD